MKNILSLNCGEECKSLTCFLQQPSIGLIPMDSSSPPRWGMDEDAVRRVFEGSCGGFNAITAVRRCRHREERTLGFLERIKSRAEWLFGWYGAAPADVEAAADGGDLRTNLPIMPAHLAHDRGVSLANSALLVQFPRSNAIVTSCSVADW